MGASRANDTYGSALKAHPGKSQGRPSTNSRSKRIEQHRPAQPVFAPGCPATRTVAPYAPIPSAQQLQRADRWARWHLVPFIPVTNAIEALNRQLRKAVKTKGHFPTEDAARKLVYSPSTTPSRNGTRTRG
jgi:Transposase, Mutator family